MKQITDEQIERAKSWDLLSYLQAFEPQELRHVSGDYYSTKTHDSVMIRDGKWTRYATGQYGSTALSYLTYVEGIPYTNAVERLAGEVTITPPERKNTLPAKREPKPKILCLPERNDNNNRVISYLQDRKIDRDLIFWCLERGLIYESKAHHNVVFVGKDEMGAPRYATCRGTGKERFFMDAKGSDKQFSFNIPANKNSATLHIYESAIDLLSFCTLQKLMGRSCFDRHHLSLSGIYFPQKETAPFKLPLALDRFLKGNPQILNIELYLDSDDKGQRAAVAILNELSQGYAVTNHVLKQGKDINDFLTGTLTLQPIRKRTYINKEVSEPEISI